MVTKEEENQLRLLCAYGNLFSDCYSCYVSNKSKLDYVGYYANCQCWRMYLDSYCKPLVYRLMEFRDKLVGYIWKIL